MNDQRVERPGARPRRVPSIALGTEAPEPRDTKYLVRGFRIPVVRPVTIRGRSTYAELLRGRVDGYLVVIANTVLHSVDVDTRETWGVNVHGGFELDVAGRTVYVGADLSDSNSEGGVDEFGQVYAYDLATGNERWATFVDGQGVQPPAVGSDTIYAGQQNGKLHALARSDGNSRWIYEGDKPVDGRPVLTRNAVVFEIE